MPIEARRQGREEPVRASSGDDKECGEARHAASSGRAASLDGHGVKFCLPLPYNSPTRGRKTRCMAFGPRSSCGLTNRFPRPGGRDGLQDHSRECVNVVAMLARHSSQLAARFAGTGRPIHLRRVATDRNRPLERRIEMRRELTAIIEREGDGYVGLCPEVDVASQGDSAAEAQENLQAAVALFFETASSAEIERRLSGGVYLTRIEEDFHVIDDPPEDEAGRGDLNVADDPEHGAESNAPPSADMRICEGDETPPDPAQPGKTARLRSATDSAAGALRRGATGIGKAARTLGDGVAGSAGAVGGRVSDVSARAGRLASDSLKKIPMRRLRPVTSAVANIGNTLLATDVALGLDRWMRAVFASGRASPYDKALDLAHNTLRQYGGDHRIFDGSHDLVGAWKAIAKARPDDSWL